MSIRLAAVLLALALGACASEVPEPRSAPTTGAVACDGSFRVTNSSSRIVSRIHMRDSALTNWGPDRLGRDVLSPGQGGVYRVAASGVHDIRILFPDGQALERRRVNICTNTAIAVGNFGINLP